MDAVCATWVLPEIARRHDAGELPEGFRLRAYQLILDDETRVTEIRLNEEVRAAVRVRSRRELARDDVVLGDEGIEIPFEILLTDHDPNGGHFTAIATDHGVLTSYDVRPNARRAAEHGDAAREYLNSAAAALKRDDLRAFVQSLFDATELMAKAYLLTVPTSGTGSGRSHSAVHRPFNLERREGRVHDSFARLLNRLSELRPAARYLEKDFELDRAEAETMLAAASEMYRALYDVVPKRHTPREPRSNTSGTNPETR